MLAVMASASLSAARADEPLRTNAAQALNNKNDRFDI
jgi:hypothetical protein